ncbi:CLUMA_CG019435, isoform A [Clunio marinus]|uniref:CLUMA_CG019435, isoform A n=1 Tax=Clunio marinus TaxID=568069 RepID=A0A1J1J3I5_9DIPT|nr:CLUMA_CG019435, isoform A [Clunio marinus]
MIPTRTRRSIVEDLDDGVSGFLQKQKTYEIKLFWPSIIAFVYLHLSAVYGLWLLLTVAEYGTVMFGVVSTVIGVVGVLAGSYRLWVHRTLKADYLSRICLMLFNTTTSLQTVKQWALDQRLHSVYENTDADPFNPERGFFFSHYGWFLCERQPTIKAATSKIDVSDLEADEVVQLQEKHFYILMPLLSFILPTFFCWYFCGDTLMNAWHIAAMFRFALSWFVLGKGWDKHQRVFYNLDLKLASAFFNMCMVGNFDDDQNENQGEGDEINEETDPSTVFDKKEN